MSEVTMVKGSKEFLYADLRTTQVLDTQPVAMCISTTADATTWVPAEWVGPVGRFRSARVLLDGTLARGRYNVFAKITDNPEEPHILVGQLRII